MIDYATTAQEIWEADRPTPALPFSPRWLRERIEESDLLRDRLEEINLREANEQEAVNKHNKDHPDDQRPEPIQHKVPARLRDKVKLLAEKLEVSKQVPCYPIPLLNLIYDEIQEQLFERGGYRQLVEFDEEERLESQLQRSRLSL